MLTYDTPALWQTGSRNLTGQKTLPKIQGIYMKLATKYQISAINSCLEKCGEKCAYMFNVYKNQLSRQTGSRNLTGPKTLPTIWHTYMKLMTKHSCHQELLRKMRRKMCIYKCMLNVYKNQQNRQTGSRNLMGPKIVAEKNVTKNKHIQYTPSVSTIILSGPTYSSQNVRQI
jgi:hypothetical protein